MKIDIVKKALFVSALLIASALSASATTTPTVHVTRAEAAPAVTTTATPAPAVTTGTVIGSPATSLATNIGPTNLISLLGGGASAQQLASDVAGFFADAQPYLSNSIGTIDAALLYDKTLPKGKIGGFLGATIPVSQQAAIGFGGAYLGNTWYDATLNIKLGMTLSLPFIGKYYGWAGSGPDYNFRAKSIGAWNALGVEKDWDLGKLFGSTTSAYLGGGFFVGNDSTTAGAFEGLYLALTAHY